MPKIPFLDLVTLQAELFGCSPVNATLPVMMPPLASSGTAGGPLAAGLDASVPAVAAGLSPPQPASIRLPARTAPIQIVFIFIFPSLSLSSLAGAGAAAQTR